MAIPRNTHFAVAYDAPEGRAVFVSPDYAAADRVWTVAIGADKNPSPLMCGESEQDALLAAYQAQHLADRAEPTPEFRTYWGEFISRDRTS